MTRYSTRKPLLEDHHIIPYQKCLIYGTTETPLDYAYCLSPILEFCVTCHGAFLLTPWRRCCLFYYNSYTSDNSYYYITIDAVNSDIGRGQANGAQLWILQLAKLKEAGLLGVKRPFTITAQATDSSSSSIKNTNINGSLLIATKLIHFQRHVQGYHNPTGETFHEMHGWAIYLENTDPAMNPFVRP